VGLMNFKGPSSHSSSSSSPPPSPSHSSSCSLFTYIPLNIFIRLLSPPPPSSLSPRRELLIDFSIAAYITTFSSPFSSSNLSSLPPPSLSYYSHFTALSSCFALFYFPLINYNNFLLIFIVIFPPSIIIIFASIFLLTCIILVLIFYTIFILDAPDDVSQGLFQRLLNNQKSDFAQSEISQF
jgi:hypothetical protein